MDVKSQTTLATTWGKNHRNTKFFHMHANQRRKTNNISQILHSISCMVSDQNQIGTVFCSFFSHLFSTSNPSDMGLCLESLNPCVTEHMNSILLAEFNEKEIQEAIFKINPLGALRPDGFSACFYQKNWPIIGKEVTSFVLEMLNQQISLDDINDTFITLISKGKIPHLVGKFRPFSFCNVIYKIVAKVLANRLKLILLDIISHTQSASVPRRLITDNVIIVYEIFHSMQS